MGMNKLLNLQMVPYWCLQLLGNPVSCLQLHQSDHEDHHRQKQYCTRSSIKLIKSDGLVKIYHKPIHVSDLMTEFPKHLVCKSDSFYIGQKIPALSESDQLQLGHKYFLLPQHCFQTVLSFVTIASLASDSQSQQRKNLLLPSSKDSRNAFLKKAATCQPFDIQKTASGCLRIRVSDEFISMLMEEKKNNASKEEEAKDGDKEGLSGESRSRVCTTPQLRKDYTQLVRKTRQWKPKLETVEEINEKRRKLSSSFGIKRRKKSHHHQSQRSSSSSSSDHHPKSSSKTKIKFRSRK